MNVYPRSLPTPEALEQLAQRHPQLDASSVRASLALLRAANQMSAAFGEHFARFGLSQARFTILMVLRKQPLGMSPAQIAHAVNVTRPTVTGLLQALEQMRLVLRRTHPHDHRSNKVTLTPKAARLLDRMFPAHFRKHAALMGGLTQAERMLLIKLLDKIRPQAVSGAPP